MTTTFTPAETEDRLRTLLADHYRSNGKEPPKTIGSDHPLIGGDPIPTGYAWKPWPAKAVAA